MPKRPKIYLCAFANLNLSTSAYRFYHQALQMGIFEDIFIHNETTLDLKFVQHFKDKFYEALPCERERERETRQSLKIA